MKVLLCGDPHGDKTYLEWMFRLASKEGCDRLVALGDLAWGWPGKIGTKLPGWLAQYHQQYQIDFYFIDGNHDNHELLDHDAQTFVQIADGSYYIPRGRNWRWGSWKFVAVGGAYSIDQDYRVAGRDWWPDEQPTVAQMNRAYEAGTCDVFLSHEAPGLHVRNNHHADDLVTYPTVVDQRQSLLAIIEELEPELAFHGHWHMRYEQKYGPTQIIGLAANVAYWPHSANWANAYYILDVPE